MEEQVQSDVPEQVPTVRSIVESWKDNPASRQARRAFLFTSATEFLRVNDRNQELPRVKHRQIARALAKRMSGRLSQEAQIV